MMSALKNENKDNLVKISKTSSNQKCPWWWAEKDRNHDHDYSDDNKDNSRYNDDIDYNIRPVTSEDGLQVVNILLLRRQQLFQDLFPPGKNILNFSLIIICVVICDIIFVIIFVIICDIICVIILSSKAHIIILRIL